MKRTAVLSDPHGNSPALEAVLEDVKRCGCDEVLVLGDVINDLSPEGCVEQLRALPRVRGGAGQRLSVPPSPAIWNSGRTGTASRDWWSSSESLAWIASLAPMLETGF